MNSEDRDLHVEVPVGGSPIEPKGCYSAWDMHLLLGYNPVKLITLLEYFFAGDVVIRDRYSASDFDLVRRIIEQMKYCTSFQECYEAFKARGEELGRKK